MRFFVRAALALALAFAPAATQAQSLPSPLVQTRTPGDNSTRAASTAYVDASAQLLINALAGKAASGANADISSLAGASAMSGVDLNFGLTSLASAATVDLGGAATVKVAITGTNAITSFGTGAHKFRLLRFTEPLALTHNATSLILPTGAPIPVAAGDTAIATSDASGNWRVSHYQRADGTALVTPTAAGTTVTVLTATTASSPFTFRPDTKRYRIRMVGAGGGSAGVIAPSSTGQAVSGGGAGGGYIEAIYTKPASGTATYQCGTGGTGGAAGNNAGTSGGDTTWTDGTVSLSAKGGGPGVGNTGGSGITQFASGGTAAANTINAAGQTGLIANKRGMAGGNGASYSSSSPYGYYSTGFGGDSPFGGGGVPATAAVSVASGSAGDPGTGYGAGASGPGHVLSTSAGRAGAAGASGAIIIEESPS